MGSTTDKKRSRGSRGGKPAAAYKDGPTAEGDGSAAKGLRAADFIRSYWIALRVFSLSLAVGGAGFGLIAAWYRGELFLRGSFDGWLLVFLVMIAGLCSQAGANLINDYFEGSFKYPDSSQRTMQFLGRRRTFFDVFVFVSGIGALGLAGLIGLYLVWRTDYVMLVIGLVGLIGSYAYTGEPFVYKRRGLGVPLSFVLMGPLMNLGAWYAVTSELSWYPVLLGLPVALFVPAMMISNEMRDFYRDHRISMGTLSVRIGRRPSIILYDLLTFGAFLLTAGYVALGFYPVAALAVWLTLPLAVSGHLRVLGHHSRSIPATNQLHLFFMSILIAALLLG
ncbi:MAG: prenyltransferase [Spirochaetaceae bacterium]